MITELKAGTTYRLIDKRSYVNNIMNQYGWEFTEEFIKPIGSDNLITLDENMLFNGSTYISLKDGDGEFFEEVEDGMCPFNDPFMARKRDQNEFEKSCEDWENGVYGEDEEFVEVAPPPYLYATGGNLTNLSKLYGIERMFYETDYALRNRVLSEVEALQKKQDTGINEKLKLPVKSDGGSSSYYDIQLPQKVIDFVKEHGYIKTEMLIEALGSDFDIGNILKCVVRITSLKKGCGKEGNNVAYDTNKIIYSANRVKEREE